ncbi:MAG: lysophospholipid acyltransferase family protein [Verrucomicrobia bacterium]|nr:lysophospholipid acyltransferase family protein [Verrucomicrobiota bacterium]
MPLSVVLAMGRGMGRTAALFGRRRKEVLDRIQSCLGVGLAEAKAIRKGMYLNLGMTAVEVLRMPYMDEAEVRSRIRYAGTEKTPPRGTPSIGLVAHTGNWELLAATTSFFIDNEMNVVVKAQKPESLNEWMIKIRSRWGTKIHDRRGSVREILRVLKNGEILAFILDQNAKRNWGIFVDFFGMPACTSDGLSEIAARTGVDTYPVFCRRLPDHNLLVTVHDPIPPPKSREPEEIRAHTQACTKAIEDFVRAHPDQWIWMHRRWRTQPETAEAAENQG